MDHTGTLVKIQESISGISSGFLECLGHIHNDNNSNDTVKKNQKGSSTTNENILQTLTSNLKKDFDSLLKNIDQLPEENLGEVEGEFNEQESYVKAYEMSRIEQKNLSNLTIDKMKSLANSIEAWEEEILRSDYS